MRSYFDARDSNERLAGEFPAVNRGIFPVFRQSVPKLAVYGAFSMAPSVQQIGTS